MADFFSSLKRTGITILGIRKTQRLLQELEGMTKNMKPVLRLIGRAVQTQSIRRSFRTGTDPISGAAWPIRKQLGNRRGRGRLLFDTGELLASLIAANRLVLGDDFVKIRTGDTAKTKIYARTHQDGRTIVPRNAERLTIPLTRQARRLGYGKFKARFSPKKTRKAFAFAKKVVIPRRRYLGIGEKEIELAQGIILARIKKIKERKLASERQTA